ncbi:hypothetical protein SUGI_0019220 [Cryptomeria japonica]|nr:hypothetical protein SUGI_0019220 [Cryptomeria japonica]
MPETYRIRRITTNKLKSENEDFNSFDSTKFKGFEQNEVDLDDGSFGSEESRSKQPSARSRWRRLKHTVSLVNHITANIKSNNGGAGGVGAATFEGVSTKLSGGRLKGRKGMEELVIRQNKSFVSLVQDLYVACLKLPILHFLMGVFLSPVLLGLLFMPLYFLDIDGLRFDGVMDEVNRTASSTQCYLFILNVFLYALSLSTTFGGSPVVAVSPFCLVVANVNTLMAQFLFVFLSGAVFARMSQPSHPIRCAKKAIIKTDDVTINPAEGLDEMFRVFAVRLVLTGPTPCELVDAKICLTFRIFNKLPDGSTFCSTHDLELVRPEVSYLRYGVMVRHVINQKSPVYGHTLESLKKGDASFSLTVMGLERSSMQPIFHLEDYFVSDGEVVWDGDYVDFIHINDKGQRVLDHTTIDLLKLNKVSSGSTQSVSQHVDTTRKNMEPCVPRSISGQGSLSFRDLWAGAINQQRLFKCKSTSFTRAGY